MNSPSLINRFIKTTVIIFLLISTWLSTPVGASAITDDEIRKYIIQQSIASYSGNCPCPYNRVSNGSLCGKRSAYSRPGGASPL